MTLLSLPDSLSPFQARTQLTSLNDPGLGSAAFD